MKTLPGMTETQTANLATKLLALSLFTADVLAEIECAGFDDSAEWSMLDSLQQAADLLGDCAGELQE